VRPKVRLIITIVISLGVILAIGCGITTPRTTRPAPAKPSPAPSAAETVIVADPVADVRRDPEDGSELLTQALYNEQVQLLGDADGWFQVSVPDGYEGWMKATSLGRFAGDESPWQGVTGRVYISKKEAPIRKEPRPDSPVVKSVYLGTPLGVEERAEGWLAVRLAGLGRGWVATRSFQPEIWNSTHST
jgi:SH3-like domain-containing protein